MPDEKESGKQPDDKDAKAKTDDKDDSGKPEKKDDKPKPPPSQPEPRSRWPGYLAIAVAVVFTAGVLITVFVPSSTVYTDDAYVTAHYATVAPRISGQVSSVLVDDNQPVKAGQPLVLIDDRDFRASLATAA